MKDRIKKSAVGFAVMGIIAASGMLLAPKASEANVRKPLPVNNISRYQKPMYEQKNAPHGNHKPSNVKKHGAPGKGNGAKNNSWKEEIWRKNGHR